ncbi:RNA-binding protein 12-like isoform X2 [Ptychodera flava]|uniref:RNA-binding protein 12-like isoform X2 n=1 Tax=Ptychodera flava TaxID=63121 RepID=UPI00396A9E66
MTIIIRLQGLPWAASALDIRHYFKGLTIPDGGVHIVGGESGDAFIAFGGDEDARKAMLLTSQPLCGKKVTLMLSSKAEMQNVIAASRAAQARKRGDPFEGAVEAANSINMPPVPDERSYERAKVPTIPPVTDDRGYDRPKLGMSLPQEAGLSSSHPGYPHPSGRHPTDLLSPTTPYDAGRSDPSLYGRPDDPPYLHRGLEPPHGHEPSRGHEPPRGHEPSRGFEAPHMREPSHLHEPLHALDPLRRHETHHGHDRSVFSKTGHDPIQQGFPYDQREGRADQPGFPYDQRELEKDPMMGRVPEVSHMGRMGEAQVREPSQQRHGAYHAERSHDHPQRRDSEPHISQNMPGEQTFRNGRFERSFSEDPYLGRRLDDTIPPGGRPDETQFRGSQRYDDRLDTESHSRPFDHDRRKGSQDGRYGEVPNFDQDRRESQYRNTSSRYSEDRQRGHDVRERLDQPSRHPERPFSGDRHGRQQYGNPDQPPFSHGMRTDAPVTSVILKGLPYTVTEEDIVHFLAGLEIERGGIQIGMDRTGKTTGDALVKLANHSDFEEALKRNRRYIGPRYINVQPCSERDWAMMSDNPNRRHEPYLGSKDGPPYMSHNMREPRRARSRSPVRDTLCISLRGLPFHTEKKHILEFFKGIEIKEEDIYLELNERGQARGSGYVEFKSIHEYRKALERNRQYIGPRYITVISISREEFQSRIKDLGKWMSETLTAAQPKKEPEDVNTKEKESIAKDDAPSKNNEEEKKTDELTTEDTCIHMQNVPYAASTADILEFLSGIPVPKHNIFRIYNDKGQTTGEVFIEFYSLEFAKKAEDRKNGNIRERTIYVDRVKKSFMEKRLKENEAMAKLAHEKRAAAAAAAANAGQPPLLATPPLPPRLVNDMRRRDWPRPMGMMGMRDQQREGARYSGYFR